MQMSNADEKKCSGGSGMHDRVIFWGAAAGYGAVASTDPMLMREETMRAYHEDSRARCV